MGHYFPLNKVRVWILQMVKNLLAVQETWVRSLGWEDPLEKEMATHSSILAWKIPWTEEPGGLRPWGHKELGSQRVGHTEQLTLVWIPHRLTNMPSQRARARKSLDARPGVPKIRKHCSYVFQLPWSVSNFLEQQYSSGGGVCLKPRSSDVWAISAFIHSKRMCQLLLLINSPSAEPTS